MILFLILSLVASLVILTVKRFHATRIYAIILVVIYVTFLITTILVETNVISF